MRMGKAERGRKSGDNGRQHNAGMGRILCFVLTLALLWGQLPMKAAEAAEEGVRQIANLVIFVKYKGDTDDIFNAVANKGTYVIRNWDNIKQMYDTGTQYGGYKDSFSNYISVITEGKVQVTNYFPQELSDGSGVVTLELDNAEAASSDDGVVAEVIAALENGTIPIDPSIKLDNQVGGILDNLTVIVQGGSISGKTRAFHKRYPGKETFQGLQVYHLNMIPSGFILSDPSGASLSEASPASLLEPSSAPLSEPSPALSSVSSSDPLLAPSSSGMQQQAVIAHEFLHTLGLPDLYRSNDNGVPVGMWDIMAMVAPPPQYPLSYLRAQQGWVDMPVITQSGTYTLTAVAEKGGNKVFALQTPLSDSEFICLEYRKQQPRGQFDYRIPSSGLLMYRVDTKVGETNSTGDNYIYVYRPGVTDPEAATDEGMTHRGVYENLVYDAALDVAAGETEYGSTDLGADFTQNTLYYSDGRNSGIRVSDLKLSADGNELTFTVTFADYTDDALWNKLGDKVSGSCMGNPVIYADPSTGDLYVACVEGDALNVQVTGLCVRRWNGVSWEQVGTVIGDASRYYDPALAVCGGELYLSYVNGSDNPVYCKLSGNSWSQVGTYGISYPMYMQFLVDGNEIYGVYQEGNGLDAPHKLVIRNLKTGAVVTDSLTATDFSCPALVKSGNYVYMVNADYGGKPQVRMYDIAGGRWSTLCTLADYHTSVHQICIQDGKIYAFAAGGWNMPPAMAVYDGSGWQNLAMPDMGNVASVSLEGIGGRLYLTYYDNGARAGKVLCYAGGSWQVYSDTLGTGYETLRTCSYGDRIYAVSKAENTSVVVVREKEVPSGGVTPPTPPAPPIPPTPPVAQEALKLTLTPPAGYTDSHIHVDGVEYAASAQNGSYSVKLPNTSGKTAVMYCYDDKNIPVGMYVWKLSWQGEICTATAMPGLQNVLSYHGFSIRVQSPAGIRFKSGIDPGLKQRLIAGSVEGCRLVEYGTLFITSENRKTHPFIKGGEKVGGGRAYWTENGVTNDKVYETVAGRARFTSVLINLKPDMYAREIAFRAYIILECDGQQLCVYGPPVSRSVYTVAKQVQAKGEFKAGSSGYRYVQGIINSVEGR